MSSGKYYFWLGLGIVLVAAVGESFKVSEYFPVGAPIAIITLSALYITLLSFYKNIIGNAISMTAAVIMLFHGLSRNNVYYVLQDFLPIFISILLFVSFRSVNPLILVYRLSPYTRIFLIVALVKVIYILVAQPVADWGDTWISAQYSLESGIPRIMLKGAAPLFFLAVVFEFINMLNNKKRSIWYLSIGVALIVLGGSRALIAATLVPSFFVLISIFKFRSSKVRIKVIFTLGLLSATIALVTGSSFRLSDPEISGDFAQVGVDSVSAAYRMLETTSAIESVQNKYIGNGLGATFYSIGSGAESSDGEGVYIHSFPVWVYVKFGLFGLIFSCVAFMIFALKYLINLQCNKNNIESITNNFFRLFSLSFICSSFVTNLLCTFTGAIVGTLLAINFLRMNKYYITK